MDIEILPLIKLSGTTEEIGFTHGTVLREKIEKTIEYYHRIFQKSENNILSTAKHYFEVIRRFNPQYCVEIEAIAKGANVDPLWITALNSRTEIIGRFVNECTAFYSSKNSILAQNWDWSRDLEPLMVMMEIEKEDGLKILQITEPGIIGKIGINSFGLGVTLNFLKMNQSLMGLPIHITLRHFLESKSIEEGLSSLDSFKFGKASNIIFANDRGSYVNLEFANNNVFEQRNEEYNLHTNHYLEDKTLNYDLSRLKSSFARFKRASEIVHAKMNLEDAKAVLSDKNNTELPICRTYIPDEVTGDMGTVSSIVMDLPNKIIHATPGNPIDNNYKEYKF